jgi:TolB-like protein/Tfp pilus assembly protein PilF
MDLGTGREIDPIRRYALPDLAGTPLYLAPEIFDGATASERTDLYSLGVLLYHLVTRSFPTRATTVAGLREGHAQGSGVRLRDARADLPTAFVTVVDRALARDPNRRYGSAGELEADLVQALDATGVPRAPAATPAPETADDSVRPRPGPWWRPRLVPAVAAAALVLAAVGWPVYRAFFPAAIRSIAVLPLANMSGDRSQDYFADAMTDELIGTLGQLGGVTVISRTSVMQFKGSTKSVPEIVKTLKVDAVLESSFMLVPGKPVDGPGAKRVRINARLIRAGSDTPLWNESFEEVVSDLLALQGRVARKVAEAIDLRLTPKQLQGTLAGTRRQNVQAQEEHFQGRYLLNRLSRDNLVLARDYLERAVRIDPTYARAYASLAQCYRYLDLYGVLSRSEAAPLALDAARTALRLDESLPEAHNLLADAAFLYEWDWTAAEREYRRAIELNPSYGFARSEYARFLMAEDRLDEALDQARLAETNDPLSAEATGVVALALYYQRHYDDAITARRRAIQLDPASPQQYLGLGRTYAQKGEFDQAIAALKEAVARSGRAPFMMAELARTYAVAGRRDEAQAIMTTLTTTDGGGSHLSAQYHTYVYAALGNYDLAFEWLDKAFAEREQNVLWARVDPRFDRLRSDPRFDAYIRRVPPRP